MLGKGSLSDKTHNSNRIPAWMMRKATREGKGNKGSFTLCTYSGGTEAVLGNFFLYIPWKVFGLKNYESAQPVEEKMKNMKMEKQFKASMRCL